MNNPKIWISKKGSRSFDAIIYDMPNAKIVDWFSLVDIWGSRGYDRFNDNGLYFELPNALHDILPELPFIYHYGITVDKEA